MRPISFRPGFSTGIALFGLLALVLNAGIAGAQEIGSLTSIEEEEDVQDVGRLHHPFVFAASASFVHMVPINILKENIVDINDLTKAGTGYMGDVRLFILDGLSLSFGGVRSGFSLKDNMPGEMALINDRFEGDPINPNNYIKLDGLHFNLTAYVGNRMMPESRFDPFLRAGFFYYDWALQEDGRGSDTIVYQDKLIESTDFGGGFGIGTDYRLAKKALLEFQMFWGYLLTGDEIKFDGLQSPVNDSYYWTNTHFMHVSLGLVIGI